MVEVHIIGEVSKAINFREPHLFISWEFKTGKFSYRCNY